MSLVVADTGVLVAAVSGRDRDHRRSADAVKRYQGVGIVVPATVSVEVDYLLRARIGPAAARAFLEDLRVGRFIWGIIDEAVLARSIEIDRRYADLDLGLVDCSVVAVAEAAGAATILTLDLSHFSVCAPTFTLEPG